MGNALGGRRLTHLPVYAEHGKEDDNDHHSDENGVGRRLDAIQVSNKQEHASEDTVAELILPMNPGQESPHLRGKPHLE